MPLENRVDPYGVLFRTPARGTLMGNRGGALHNEAREIVRPWKTRRWIACVLEFKGRHRTVMTPRRYTELFFLDEAVAFAAGHRPCAECRRERFNAFKAAWSRGPVLADAIDLELDRHRKQRTWRASPESLPDGAFVELDRSPWLLWNGALLLWTPAAYTQRRDRPKGGAVTVLTPRPIVDCFRRGYQPQIHPSAFLLDSLGELA